MIKILVFGTGGLWSLMKRHINFEKLEIVAFINSVKPNNPVFEELPVILPQEISQYTYDYILLASGNVEALMQQLTSLDIPKDKMVMYKINGSQTFMTVQANANQQISEFSNHRIFDMFVDIPAEPFYLVNMNMLGRARMIHLDDPTIDYVRLSTLELIAEEIHSNRVPGNVAELGVYKGNFAKHINRLFSDRKLYLFDTFEGFDPRDVHIDKDKKYSVDTHLFDDTNLDIVLSKMAHPDNIEVKKGYFPETTAGVDDLFSFVSIDVDLYKPIYDGLCFFYPRLAKGGYIFVHDYNNAIYKGAKEAVKHFCQEHGIPFIPVSDSLGTVIIAK